MLAKPTALIAAVATLVLPAVASAHRHGHHGTKPRHHHVRKADVQREYWPILEEWLTPQEGREVEEDVCAELRELAEAGVAEAC